MRRLAPDSRGIIQLNKKTVVHDGHVNVYVKPNPSISTIDRLLSGGKPSVCITRRQGGIGDVLMTTPTVKAISMKYDIKLDYGTDFKYLDGALPKVLKYNPYINKVLPWRDVDNEDYDAVIDLTCPCIAHEKPGAEPINRVDLFARHAGIPLVNTDLDYYITDQEHEWARDYILDNGLDRFKLILVQASASALARDMPIDKIKRSLANIMSLRRNIRAIVITHGTDNKKTDWNFAEIHQFHNYDIRSIAAIMAQCHLVVCPDSAILHLAAALHHPTFTLFGPTDPRARVNYHPEAIAYWPAKELKSYPIWYQIPNDGYLCWKRIEEAVVTKSILAMLDETPLPLSRDFVSFGPHLAENQYYEIL